MPSECGSLARAGRRAGAAAAGATGAACLLVLVALLTPAPLTASAPTRVTVARDAGCAAAQRLPNRPLRVGVVLATAIEKSSWDAVVYRGLQRAVRDLGVTGRAYVRGPRETGFASFSYLARQGYDLVVGTAAQVGLEAAALRYPRTCFLSLDGSIDLFSHRPANLRGTVYRVEQAAYLAGYLAALVERQRPGKHVVSSVGGFKVPPVDQFIGGFQAGARKADPNVTLLNGYSQDFERPASCRRLALHQIARGSRVVFNVAGACGLGALQAAREKHAWGIGVDTDQSSLGPHVLTSVLKNLDVALVRAVKSLQNGTFRTGTDATLSLRDGGVGLGKISPAVPHVLIDRMERIRRQLISGKLRAADTPG